MIWIMLATLAVVFVVGFRVLTSGARKAIRRLSDRLPAKRRAGVAHLANCHCRW